MLEHLFAAHKNDCANDKTTTNFIIIFLNYSGILIGIEKYINH